MERNRVNVNFPRRTALPVPMQLEVCKEGSWPPGSGIGIYIHQALTEHLLCTWQ